MKKYTAKVRRRDSALTNSWYYEKKPLIIEARNEKSAYNKLDKIARRINNDYRRAETTLQELTEQ